MFRHCEKLPKLGVGHFNTAKVTDLTEFCSSCLLITELDISNFNVDKVTTLTDMMAYNSNMTTVIVPNATVANKIVAELPSRTSTTAGTLKVTGSETGINSSAITAKNWTIQ
jgi:surface protein